MKILFGIMCTLMAFAQDANEKPAAVKELGFKYADGKSTFEIEFDKEVQFDKNVSDADKQVVLEFKNAKIAKKWQRRLDTSQYKSNIALISPYQSSDYVRVVLQLKDNAGVEVSQSGNKIIALIDNNQPNKPKEDLSQSLTDSSSTTAAPDASKAEESEPEAAAAPATSSTSTPQKSFTAAESDATLNEFFEAQKTKKYVGKKVFIQVRDAELTDIFRIISEASEFNIVVSESVKAKITLNLTDLPWDQALDLILQTHRLAAERHGNVLRVTTIDALTSEKEAEAAAKRAEEAAEPLVVKIFPISYASITELSAIVTDFLSKDVAATGAGQGGAAGATKRGSIQGDTRTNSLIVRDTPSTIEKIKRIIQELDTQTPQVLIEAKFVEIKEVKNKDIQGRIFSTSRELDSTGQLAFRNSNNNYGTAFQGAGSASPAALPTGFSITPTVGAALGFMPKIGLIPGLGEIGAFLSILESESSAKVIGSPRIVTQNRRPASIVQGQIGQILSSGGANVGGTISPLQVTLRMNVTPQITNDGGVSMHIDFAQDTPSASPLAGAAVTTDTKQVQTDVLIDSGATLVIGGVYQTTVNESESGIPFLRNLPIIGNLFGQKGSISSKTELFIFLTPRVINEKEAGLKG